jgi:hypothetical protein
VEVAVQFMFDGGAIFIPQCGQSEGVARRLAELEQGGASSFGRSEIGRVRERQAGGLENSRKTGGVGRQGMKSGVMARMRVIGGNLGGGV